MKLKNILKEVLENKDTINLYHGTCPEYADLLLKHGWSPNKIPSGGNSGSSEYLYLTSGEEDAEWYANEKGCGSILLIKNIPVKFLKPDPDDEAGYSMEELLDSLKTSPSLPRKFILIKPIPSNYFKVIK